MTASKHVLLIYPTPEATVSGELSEALRRNGAKVTEHIITGEAGNYAEMLDALCENVVPVVVKLNDLTRHS